MDFNEAKKIMELNARFYDLLADDFARSRASAQEEFAALGGYFKDGDSVLDLGCGNGRFYELICPPGKEIKYFGLDNSSRLIEMAKQKYPQGQFILGDGLALPFGENFFDKVLCAAALHHLPGYDLRREFLRQAYRVLKEGGWLVLTTAATSWSSRRWWPFLKYAWLKILGKSKLDWGDFYEPWGSGENKGLRYYHDFSPKEIKSLLEDVGFVIESLSFLTRKSGEKNMVVVARK